MKFTSLFHSIRQGKLVFASGVLLVAGGLVFNGQAQVKPKHRPEIPNFDKRPGAAQKQGLAPSQSEAQARLKAAIPSVQVDFDSLLQAPQFIRITDGFLSGPNGQGRAMAKNAALSFDGAVIVRAFIDQHPGLFGHDSSVLNDARVKRDYSDNDTQLRTMVWEQQLDGIPVYQASLIGHVTKRGELVSISSLFVPAASAAADAATPNRAELIQKTPLSIIDAMVAGAKNLGLDLAPASVTETQDAVLESGYRLFKTPEPAFGRMVWLPLNRSSLRLAWEVMVGNPKTKERFRLVVDAQSGEVYLRQNMTWYISDASYAVYTGDSPSPFTPGLAAPGIFQPPYTNRILMVGPALDTNASPIGWIDDGNNTTTGNNADAFLDRDFDQQPDIARPVGNPNRVFNFPLDLAMDPTNYIDAATVQLFYRANWYHDRLYQLGFTESAGNYQERNFGRGGFGNDSILCYVQSGADIGISDNSMFMSAPDGYNGQCFMFVFSFPNPVRDGSLDQEVVIHELTHGTSSRLVGGGMGLNNIQAGGMGEGWSDFYALCLLSETNDDVNAAYPSGGYASYLFAGLDENYYYGIRHFPYSTDLQKNPFTFKDIDPGQISAHAGVPRSPMYGFDAREADEVHHQGEVWCSMLWEVRANLVTKYGWGIGNELALRLVTDGMKLTPPNPNFIQARDGILLADLIRTSGINATDIWRGFAKRGLGASAKSPNGDTTSGVVEAFDVIGLQVDHTFITGGNENGAIDYDECNDLYIALINGGTVGATNVEVSISTTTPKAYVMQRVSAYPDIAPGGMGTNLTPFKISTGPTFVCGTPIALKVIIKSDAGTQGVDLLLPTGTNGAPIRFNSFFPVLIPDNSRQGTNSVLFVTNIVGAIQNVTVSLYTIHPFDGDLTFELIGPDGTKVVLVDRNGGAGQNYGLACAPETSRTTFDDRSTNAITAGRSPYLGSFKPEQPLAAFAGKSGTNANGIWQLHIIDNAALDVGSLQCWSLSIQPAECKAGGGQCPGVDLGIAMTANPDPAVVGSNLLYTIAVTNRGPGTAVGTVVSHTLPSGAIFVSAVSSQGNCSQAGGAVTATLGNLRADEVATIEVMVIPTIAGTAFSSASVTSAEPELGPVDNTVAIRTIVAPPSSDIAVGISDTPDPVVVGGKLAYTVGVTNRGPATASGIILTNILPAGLQIGSIESSQGSVTVSGNVVICNIGLLPKNGFATATINVTPTLYGTLTATAKAGAVQPDPLLANNTSTATTSVGQASDLGLGITARPDPAVLGSNVTFTITVTNLGPNTATNVTVTQSLPAGVNVSTVSLSQGTYAQSGSTLICSVGTLLVGGSANVRVVVTTSRVGTLTSSATVTSAQADPSSENNSGVASAQVAPPFVSIVSAGTTLTAENFYPANGSLDAGETVTIQFRLQNSGNVANTNLVATLLPGGGVTAPSGPQAYGILRPIGVSGGAPVSRPFTFTAGPSPNGVITATLQLQDGATNLPAVNFTFKLPQVYRFANTSPIVIREEGKANPYPSTIEVSGVTGQVGRVTATLARFSHDFPHDVNVLLVGPNAVKTLLLSHAGNFASTYNVDLTFDDGADAPLPATGGLAQGNWRPSVYAPDAIFGAPAPAGPYSSLLSDFNGMNGNGTWSLYVMDDHDGDAGVIDGGWALELTSVSPVNQLADVGVSVAATPSPVLVGEPLTYVWTITNAGPTAATGVTFSNELPTSVTFVSAAVSQGNWITNGGLLEANFGTIDAGASVTLTAVVQPQVGSPALITNMCVVSAFESDLHTGDNRTTASTAVNLPLVGLTLAARANLDPVIVGSNLTFSITVTNNGPDKALNVAVLNPLPSGATFVAATVSRGAVAENNGVVVATIGDLPAGAQADLEITVSPQIEGPLTNVTRVTTASTDAIANNTATVSVTVNAPAAEIVAAGARLVSESSVPANGTLESGEVVTLYLGLANEGVVDAVNLTATLLPTGGVVQPSGPAVYGLVRRGTPAVFKSFSFTVDPAAVGPVTATLQLTDGTKSLGTAAFSFSLPQITSVASSGAILIPERGIAVPYPAVINVSGLEGVVGQVTVSLNQFSHSFPSDVSVLLASPGRPTVLLMSHNGGSYPVTNLTFTFSDVAGSYMPESGRLSSGSYLPSRAGREVAFSPPAPLAPYSTSLSTFTGMEPNGTWAIYIVDESTGDAGALAGGWTLNITTIKPVNPIADVALAATPVPSSILFGSRLTYTFSVTNSGPAAAPGVVLTDVLPVGVMVISNSLSQGTGRLDNGQFIAEFGSLDAGSVASATLTILPNTAGTIVNRASLSGSFTDLNLADNEVVSTTTVVSVVAPTLSASFSGGLLQLTVTGQPGGKYAIEASTILGAWSAISTNSAGTDGIIRYTDPDSGQLGHRFYRAVRQQ